MEKQDAITPEMLRQLLEYDSKTGHLFWKHRDAEMFSPAPYFKNGNKTAAKQWNAKHAGKRAFTTVEVGGYEIGRVLGYTFKAHRVIWAIAHGAWPEDQIDHINGVRTDNRLLNLRPVSQSENSRNTKTRSDSTSGVCGVYWHKEAKKWAASIAVNGVRKHLGLFETIEDAAQERRIAERQEGFHPNHGRGA